MREKQILPLVVVALTGALVAVVALWTLDRVDSSHGDLTQNDASGLQSAPKVIEWKLVTTWPKGLPGLGAAPENFARRVNEASGGRLRIKVFGAGEIVPAFEVFDAVSRGVAEAGHGASYYWKGKIPAAVFFTAVPFGMTAQEANGWLHYGGGWRCGVSCTPRLA
jgi:TRAP-type mannitol/chloroaromatic compound transport system substrate-binding protein